MSDQSTRPAARPGPTRYRRNLPHLQDPGRTFHITFSTRKRSILPERVRDLVLGHCLHDQDRRYWLHAAVVMPDHVHLLLTPLRDDAGATYTLSEIMRGIKGSSARSVNRAMVRQGALWEEESFDHQLRADDDLRGTAAYVCDNPVRAGLVGEQDQYPWLWRVWREGAETEANDR